MSGDSERRRYSERRSLKVSVSHTVEYRSQITIDDTDNQFARRKGWAFGIRFADPVVENSYQEDSLAGLQPRYRHISVLLAMAASSNLIYHAALADEDSRVRVAASTATLLGFSSLNAVIIRVRAMRNYQQTMLAVLCGYFFLWSQYFFCGIYRQPMTHAIDLGLMGLVMASQYQLRFHTVVVTLLLAWIAFAVHYSLVPSLRANEQPGLAVIMAWIVCFLSCYSAFIAEVRRREDWKQQRGLKRHVREVTKRNEELVDEVEKLRAETTMHGAGPASLVSPLEKLLEELEDISRSIGETRSGEAERLHGIMARLAMFDGKSMMVPDLEKATRDPETRDWLLREVAPHNASVKSRRGAGGSGGGSFLASVRAPRSGSGISPQLALVPGGRAGRRMSHPAVFGRPDAGDAHSPHSPATGAATPHSTGGALGGSPGRPASPRSTHFFGAGPVPGAPDGPSGLSVVPVDSALLTETDLMLRRAMANLDDWFEFDIWRVSELTGGRPLVPVTLAVIERHGLVERFGLDALRLSSFLRTVEQHYLDNPYHSAVHATDVVQSLHYLLLRGGLASRMLTDLDVLAAILAAVVHDLGHGGFTNAFEIATSSERALVYNDKSPLENYHVSKASMLLRKPELDFLTALSPEERKELRKQTIAMVLSTDLAVHFELMGQFKARAAQEEFGQSAEEKALALNLAIKAADVANAAKRPAVYLRWVDHVMAEFFRQGDEERSRSLPISAFMDRRDPQIPKCQTGFLDFIVLPMYTALCSAFPDARALADGAKANREYWANATASSPSGAGGNGIARTASQASAAPSHGPLAPAAGGEVAPVSNRSHGAASNGGSVVGNAVRAAAVVNADHVAPPGTPKPSDSLRSLRGLEPLPARLAGIEGLGQVMAAAIPPGVVLSRRGSRSHAETPPPLAPFAFPAPGPAPSPDPGPASVPRAGPTPERRGSLSGPAGAAPPLPVERRGSVSNASPGPRGPAGPSNSTGSLDASGRENGVGPNRGRRPSITVLGADGTSLPLST